MRTSASAQVTINLCFVKLAKLSDTIEHPDDVQTATDETRAASFRKPEDRLRFCVGRRLARSLVAHLTNCPVKGIRIAQKCKSCGSPDHGQPFATHPGGAMPLSISHSGDVVGAASMGGAAVGLDIQRVEPDLYHEALLERIESVAELGRTPRTPEAFTRLWTCKEAILKCDGAGLMRSPRSIEVVGPLGRLRNGQGCIEAEMQLATTTVMEDHILTVASPTSASMDLRIEWT